MDWDQIIAIAISATSFIVAILSLKESTRKRNIEAITLNRMEWIKDVRTLLSEFAITYRLHCEDKDALRRLEIRLLMYFRKDTSHYNYIIGQLENCCCSDAYSEKEYEKLIILSQRELSRAWERMKAECLENLKSDRKHVSKVIDYVDKHTAKLLQMYNELNNE